MVDCLRADRRMVERHRASCDKIHERHLNESGG